jgi:thioredoxin 2
MPDTVFIACPHCNTTNRVVEARLADGATCGSCGKALFPEKPIELTGANFDRQVSKTALPLVVDFWAPWCGPCRMMAPAFEQAAAQLGPRVRLAKLNTEEAPEIAARFGIRSIPTLVAFREGREVARQSGALALPQLMQWVNRNVAQP